jgi:hypothetical protein
MYSPWTQCTQLLLTIYINLLAIYYDFVDHHLVATHSFQKTASIVFIVKMANMLVSHVYYVDLRYTCKIMVCHELVQK